MVLIKKNFLNPLKNLGGNHVSIGEKLSKPNKKMRKKTKELIDEKSPKLDEEIKRKTYHTYKR